MSFLLHLRKTGIPVLGAALLAALALCGAPRGATASGIMLSWDDCGIGGARNKSFACAVTTGADVLVASYIPPGGISQFEGIDASIEIQTAQSTLPPWWLLQGSGACRNGSLSFSLDFGAYSGCSDFWLGRNAVGGMNYEAAYQSANRGRIRLIAAVPENQRGPVSAGTEYYAFRILINHAKSSGGGACAGCLEPACITFTSLLLTQPAGVGDNILTATGGSALVTWQGGSCTSGTQTGTWGKLKSIYR